MWKNSIILQANVHSFFVGDFEGSDEVQSRYFVWCRSGRGAITVNGSRFELVAGNFIVAPWGHAIRYTADAEVPFVIGSIHIIPELPPGSPVVRSIWHKPQPFRDWFKPRQDMPWAGFETPRFGWAATNGPLLSYADFIVQTFHDHAEETELRALVPVLVCEIENACRHQEQSAGDIPIGLQEMLNFIENHLERPISAQTLSLWSSCSVPTVFRLFRRHLQQTPGNWIYHRKMLHAAQLLVSTNLSVGEIAARVAVNDPYYFSRLFKRHLGMSAKTYRRTYALDTLM